MFHKLSQLTSKLNTPRTEPSNGSQQDLEKCRTALSQQIDAFDSMPSSAEGLAMSLQMPKMNEAGLFESEMRELNVTEQQFGYLSRARPPQQPARSGTSQNGAGATSPVSASGSTNTASSGDFNPLALSAGHLVHVPSRVSPLDDSWVLPGAPRAGSSSQQSSASSSRTAGHVPPQDSGSTTLHPSFADRIEELRGPPLNVDNQSDGTPSLNSEDLQAINDAEIAERYLKIFSDSMDRSIENEKKILKELLATAPWIHALKKMPKVLVCSLGAVVLTSGGALIAVGAGSAATIAGSSLTSGALTTSAFAVDNMLKSLKERNEMELCVKCADIIRTLREPSLDRKELEAAEKFLTKYLSKSMQSGSGSRFKHLFSLLSDLTTSHQESAHVG